MAFKDSLQNLVSAFDEQNVLFRQLVRSIQDIGGTTHHLNDWLADAKADKDLTRKIAKLIVGPVWELADKPAYIRWSQVDFECSPMDFLKQHPFAVHPNMDLRTYGDGAPAGACKHYLDHFQGRSTVERVLEAYPKEVDTRREHAGWRELVLYLTNFKKFAPRLEHFRIMAGGSRDKDNLFVVANVYKGKFELGWYGLEKRETFGPDCFWLTRLYDK